VWETAKKKVGHRSLLDVPPQRFDIIEVRAVLWKPENFQVLLDLCRVEVGEHPASSVHGAIVEHENDPLAPALRPSYELSEEQHDSLVVVSRPELIEQFAGGEVQRSENWLLSIGSRSWHSELGSAKFPQSRQVGVEVELAAVGVPERKTSGSL
jgi:hypothetical protein